ncbi:hypothetical protein SteCoe_32592 [Stentor coeruleus]|uniref:Uncharacterized protein n=1 Tax=Stentor coeruleus TaxID=5963 RepID=A0A1R2AYP5_9CILI|nr:hypothetical protein SteCoe_32592 [Stentor coeruleus]
MFFPESPTDIYRKTLSRHKHLIQSNKYAQELEKKYNKFRHKTHQEKEPNSKIPKAPHLWPIHSNVFTQVLRSKLNSVLKTNTPKSQTRPVTRIKYKSLPRSMNSTRRQECASVRNSAPLALFI